jgi:hypothetical protein
LIDDDEITYIIYAPPVNFASAGVPNMPLVTCRRLPPLAQCTVYYDSVMEGRYWLRAQQCIAAQNELRWSTVVLSLLAGINQPQQLAMLAALLEGLSGPHAMPCVHSTIQ